MELQQAIANRRSVKKFKRDMHIDDALLYQAIEKAADAPNHGMREPWRVVHVPKDRLGEMSKDISKFAFPNELDKQQSHYDAVTNLGGMLLLILKTDPRQRQNDENYFAFGAYTQNLMLLLYEAGIGTCWKSPLYIYDPKVRKTLRIKKDEVLAGFLYLTDLEDHMPKAPRKNRNLITLY
ncbi:nitroreductase family protein [Staphylococcus argenteus]|uniref:nitroreductase family protein n=1 Tax=Staphylococcus argenteus TaxID=985002 RepID=UPI00091F198D|nr:nitroreductase [Staphylococcus argenteus]SGW94405.1 nitroreductase family protein [Staphylococcus argenteus]